MLDPTVVEAAETAQIEPAATDTADAPSKKKLNWGGRIAAAILIVIVAVGVVSPFLTADPIKNDVGRVIEGCGKGGGLPLYDPINCVDRKAKNAQARGEGAVGNFPHLLGVDGAGRDVFSQLTVGTRTSLEIALGSVLGALIVGGALGVLAGYFGGRVDYWASLLFDVFLAYPALVLALALISVRGHSVFNISFTVGIVAVPLIGRIARAATLTWSEREFVTAAKALGAKHGRVIIREILPNVLPSMMSIAFLAVGVVIVTEGSLAIIGLGVPDDVVSWGKVLAVGGTDLRNLSHMMISSAVLITITVMALNLLGDAIRQKFDVRESAL